METITKLAKSRTVWTVVVMFIIGGTNGIMGLIPAGSVIYVQGALSVLAAYFKLSPSQDYSK